MPVGDVTSAASPWPTEMKSMRSGAGGAAAATVGVTTTAARSKRRSSRPTPRRYGHEAPQHKHSDRQHAAVSAATAIRFPNPVPSPREGGGEGLG